VQSAIWEVCFLSRVQWLQIMLGPSPNSLPFNNAHGVIMDRIPELINTNSLGYLLANLPKTHLDLYNGYTEIMWLISICSLPLY